MEYLIPMGGEGFGGLSTSTEQSGGGDEYVDPWGKFAGGNGDNVQKAE